MYFSHILMHLLLIASSLTGKALLIYPDHSKALLSISWTLSPHG